MTKYILHGGGTKRQTEDNKKFFAEIVRDLDDGANILCAYFAVADKETWAERLDKFKMRIAEVAPQKVFNFILADDKTEVFVGQIKKADVIYLHGGDTNLLKNKLKEVDNFAELVQGKIVVGSSAGAYVLSKYYYTNSGLEVDEGLGLLPIKTFCHYEENKVAELERLKKHGEDLEIYKIPEEKFFNILKI